MPAHRTRKPRKQKWPQSASAACAQSKPADSSVPQTSAVVQPKHKNQNLTLHDWVTVVGYHDSHQPISQKEVVKYFASRQDGALHFNQATLSHHLSKEGHACDQALLNSNPTALSQKRVRVVTRPDVEEALVLWVKHMEEKGKHVSGPMLLAKQKKFEDALQVPLDERLDSDGWLAGFCKTLVITLILIKCLD